MPFLMVLNSMTFNDLEPMYRMYIQHFFTTSAAHHTKQNEDRRIQSATKNVAH